MSQNQGIEYCQGCGSELEADAVYCKYCGTKRGEGKGYNSNAYEESLERDAMQVCIYGPPEAFYQYECAECGHRWEALFSVWVGEYGAKLCPQCGTQKIKKVGER